MELYWIIRKGTDKLGEILGNVKTWKFCQKTVFKHVPFWPQSAFESVKITFKFRFYTNKNGASEQVIRLPTTVHMLYLS